MSKVQSKPNHKLCRRRAEDCLFRGDDRDLCRRFARFPHRFGGFAGLVYRNIVSPMASETSDSCSVVVESKPTAVVEVCKGLLKRLEEEGFAQDDAFAVHLALEEAFANAVKHGNKMDPDKKVTVSYSVTQDRVEIKVTDEGEGFNPGVVPDPRHGRNLFKPNGRGVLLIHSYMDVVRYSDEGRTVHMIRYRDRPSVLGMETREM